MLRPVASFLRGFFGPSESHHCVLTPHGPPCWPSLTITVPLLSPDIWSFLCPDLYCHRPRLTPVMLWSHRRDYQYLILRHVFSFCMEPEGLWSLSVVPIRSRIRPDLATHAFDLSQPTFASTLLLPVFRALSSEQPWNSPLFKPHFLARAFPCWLQRHPRQGSTTEHEEKCLASYTGCLKRPSNQRVQRYLGNHVA